MAGDFVLLGAGFSRALSESMPLLPELGRLVLAELGQDEGTLTPFAGNLEQWLSYLSTDQPWLSDSDNMRNRATFADASRAVQTVIAECERRVGEQPPECWALRLIWDWCQRGSNVATFNYDVLVERLTTHLRLARTWTHLYAMPLTERRAPGSGLMLGYSEPTWPLYTLYKLHGSTNWMYGGLDAPVTERAVITDLGSGWGAWKGASVEGARPSSMHDDLAPLIVPPTGTKAPYYGNRSLRAQWQRAFEELTTADSVTVIGYSFPPSDLVTRHFFASARVRCPVTVVDYREEAAEPVRQLAPVADVNVVSGEAALSNYVAATCGDLLTWAVVRTEEGFIPRLIVNDVDQSPSEPPTWDRDALRALLERLIDGRWPGVRPDPPFARLDEHENTWYWAFASKA